MISIVGASPEQSASLTALLQPRIIQFLDSVDSNEDSDGLIWFLRTIDIGLHNLILVQEIARHRPSIIILDQPNTELINCLMGLGVSACLVEGDLDGAFTRLVDEILESNLSPIRVRESKAPLKLWKPVPPHPVKMDVLKAIEQVGWDTPGFIILVDVHHHVFYVNRTARLMLGVPNEDAAESVNDDKKVRAFVDEYLNVDVIQGLLCEGIWIGERNISASGAGHVPVKLIIIFHQATSANPAFVSIIAHDIKVQKQTELALRESKFLLERLMEVSPVVVYALDPEKPYDVRYVTANITKVLGYPVTFVTEHHQEWLSWVHPEDQYDLPSVINELLETDEVSLAYRIRHHDGSYRWLQEHIRTLRDSSGKVIELFGYFWDITERRHSIEQLKASEFQFRALAEASQDFIYQVSSDGKFIYVNSTVCRILDLPFEAIVGKPYTDFFSSPFASFPGKPLPEAIEKKWPEYSETQVELNGKLIWLGTWLNLVQGDDGAVFLQGVSRDITQQVEKEHELAEAYQQARQSNLLRSRFVTVMTQQFEKPLNDILDEIEVLLHRSPDAPIDRKGLQAIQRQTIRLKELLDTMSDFGTDRDESLPRQSQRFDLIPLVKEISDTTIREQKSHTKVSLHTQNTSAVVDLDRSMVRKIIEAFINNAVRYQQGPGTVEICITVEDDILVEIKDSGIGISEEDIPLMFEPFFRGDNALEFPGVGLDLPLAKNAADLLGIRIEVHSKIGKGTTVLLWFPRPPQKGIFPPV